MRGGFFSFWTMPRQRPQRFLKPILVFVCASLAGGLAKGRELLFVFVSRLCPGYIFMAIDWLQFVAGGEPQVAVVAKLPADLCWHTILFVCATTTH
jgi:hypothetical protein